MAKYVKLPSGKKARRTGKIAVCNESGYRITVEVCSGRITAVKIRG